MSSNHFEFSHFKFDNKPCSCVIDRINVAPNTPPRESLKFFSSTGDLIHYAFSPGHGLVRSGIGGKIYEDDVLGKILALNCNDKKALVDFFSHYGFIFPTSSMEYTTIELSTLEAIIQRTKNTVLLMGSLAESENEEQMLQLILPLLYDDPVSTDHAFGTYSTNESNFHKLITNPQGYIAPAKVREMGRTGMMQKTLHFPNKPFAINSDMYHALISAEESPEHLGISDTVFQGILNLFFSENNMFDKETQEIVDFLFVFQYEVGILHQDMTGNIGFYGTPKFERFTKELREETRRIARYVIADEINSNINCIRLQYDGSELEPSWVVPDLLSALYFSIFYLEPGKEMYRRCENPRCNHMKYFSVPITTKNKKYCCVACERAVAQRNYRKNHRN